MSLRDEMPFCAAFVDAIRAEFGVDGINEQLRKGNFYARENGLELGKRAPAGVMLSDTRPVAIGTKK